MQWQYVHVVQHQVATNYIKCPYFMCWLMLYVEVTSGMGLEMILNHFTVMILVSRMN